MKIVKKHFKDIKSFTISRSIWARGSINTENGKNALLNSNGSMCCLGFYTKKCGFLDNEILNIGTPSVLYNNFAITKGRAWLANYEQKPIYDISWKTKLLFNKNLTFSKKGDDSDITDLLTDYNDRIDFSEEDREKIIKKYFAKIGVKVRFVD